jgi:hypothetical protein
MFECRQRGGVQKASVWRETTLTEGSERQSSLDVPPLLAVELPAGQFSAAVEI